MLSKTLSLLSDRKSSCSTGSCIADFAQRQITRLIGLRSGARLSPLGLIPAQVPQSPALCPGDLQVPRLLSGQGLIVMSQGRGAALVTFLLSLPLLCAGPTDQFPLLFASGHFCSLPSSPISCSLSKLKKKKSVLQEASGVSLNLGVYVAGGREENAPQGKIEDGKHSEQREYLSFNPATYK